jgi:hypothetical protein
MNFSVFFLKKIGPALYSRSTQQVPGSSANNFTISQVLEDPITTSTHSSICLAPCFNLNNITPTSNRVTSQDQILPKSGNEGSM